MTHLASTVRDALLPVSDVSRLNSLRRATILFSQGQAADSTYLIEEGLVKLTHTNEHGGRIIFAIVGPGQLIGEEALGGGSPVYHAEAEVLTPAAALRIPGEAMNAAVPANPELAKSLVTYLLERKLAMAKKVEMLCLHDVEYRILYYLAELSSLVKPSDDGEGSQIPITQLELADLVGATRETTSTTLNQLERRGLVKLSRRLMTVPSPETLRSAQTKEGVPAGTAAGA